MALRFYPECHDEPNLSLHADRELIAGANRLAIPEHDLEQLFTLHVAAVLILQRRQRGLSLATAALL